MNTKLNIDFILFQFMNISDYQFINISDYQFSYNSVTNQCLVELRLEHWDVQILVLEKLNTGVISFQRKTYGDLSRLLLGQSLKQLPKK